MNPLAILLIIVNSAWICQAYPHDMGNLPHDHHDHHHHDHHHNIVDLAANIAVSIKMNVTLGDPTTPMKSSELMNCVSQEYRNNIHEQCDEKFHDQKDFIPPMAAECVLTMIKALDNVTGLLDVAILKAQTIELSSLTPEQKKLASASLESCVESNFTLPDPPPFVAAAKNMTMDNLFNGLKKYDKRSNPMRVMVCIACALIENGCSSVPIEKKSDLIAAPVGVGADISSEENEALDDEDDDDVIASQV